MKTIKFVPEVCKGEAATFDGYIDFAALSFDQRCEYLEKVGTKVGEDGKLESVSDRIALMRSLVATSKAHYLVVDLTKKSTGEVYKSFDDMTYDPDCYPILNEVAMLLIQGLSMGNPSKPL